MTSRIGQVDEHWDVIQEIPSVWLIITVCFKFYKEPEEGSLFTLSYIFTFLKNQNDHIDNV